MDSTEQKDLDLNESDGTKDDLESMQILDSISADYEVCQKQEGDTEQDEDLEQDGDMEQDGETSYDPTEPTDATAQEAELQTKNPDDTSVADKGEGSGGANRTGGIFDNRRMSGAARKRYKWFLANGHGRDEARNLALDKTIKITDWAKLEQIQSQQQRPAQELNPESQIIKVGILPEKFPLASLSKEDMEIIQGNILNKVLEKGGDVKPKFLGTNYKTGWFVLKCANKDTAEWIKSISDEILGPGEQPLRIVDNAEVPKSIMVYAYFPKSSEDTDEKVLQLIAAQNDKLNVMQWRVTQREIEGPSLRLSIAIDAASDEILQGLQYRIAYKFGFINLRTEDKEKERKAVQKSGPPPPKKKAKPFRKPSPPRRREPPRRSGPERSRGRPGDRRGGRVNDRKQGRGGSTRVRRDRDRRARDERFDRRERVRINSRPPPFSSFPDIRAPLTKMPPTQGFSGSWDTPSLFNQSNIGDMSKPDEISYYNTLKNLEEYNRSLGGHQSSQGQGNWYSTSFGNQRH